MNAALALRQGDYTLSTSDPDDDESARTWVRATGDYDSSEQASVAIALDQAGRVSEIMAQRNLRTGPGDETVSGRCHRILPNPVEPDDLDGVLDQVVADVATTQDQQFRLEREFNQHQDPGRFDEWHAQATAPDTVFFQRSDPQGRQAEALWVRTDSDGVAQEVMLNAGSFTNLTLTGEQASNVVRQVGHYPAETEQLLQDVSTHRLDHGGQRA